jgi:hypothetical protein
MFVPTQTTNRPAFGWRFLHGGLQGVRNRYARRRGGLEGLAYRFPRRRGGFEGLGCDCMRKLGDDTIVVPPEIPYSPTGVPGSQYGGSMPLTQPPPILSTIDQSLLSVGNQAPATPPATLLAAAQLPGAPASVVQAAAQYRAANPIGSIFAGTTGGISNTTLILGGGAALLLLVAVGSQKRK